MELDGEEVEVVKRMRNDKKEEEEEKKIKKKYEDREYQTWFYNRAIEENVIICLPTGSGKTFIATKVVQYYLSLNLEKKIVFLATTVPLVLQQGAYLQDKVLATVGVVTGEMNPEDWSGMKWQEILSRHKVFVMTDQIMRHAVERAHIQWKDVSLMILDECHNATKDHPMSALMNFYRTARMDKSTMEDLPRVVGLSATLVVGNSKVNDIGKEIKGIQQRFCSKAITYKNYEEVLKCATKAKVEIRNYSDRKSWCFEDQDPNSGETFQIKLENVVDEAIHSIQKMGGFVLHKVKGLPREFQTSTSLLSEIQIFWNKKDPIKELLKNLTEVKDVLIEMGPYCARNAVLMRIAYLKFIQSKQLRKRNEKVVSAVTFIIQLILEQLYMLDRLFTNFFYYASPRGSGEDFYALHFISPKVQELVQILSSTKSDSIEDICGIIFCQKRITAQMVCYFVQDLSMSYPEKFGFLNCSFAIGTSGGNSSVIQSIAMRKQAEVLQNFRDKKINILAATKVLEEGLDVPSCNLIIRYDPILTFPSYIQSMGRARQEGAKFYALVSNEDSCKESARVTDYQTFNNALSENLIANLEHSEAYYGDMDVPDSDLNRLVPPFKPTSGPQMITAGSAIQTVYRYCSSLISDKLSTVSPFSYWYRDVEGRFKVIVELPPGSCVKHVEGDYYDNIVIAKKAAFLKTCKELWKCGVLNEKTMLPMPRYIPTHLTNFIDALEGLPKVDDGKKIGSKNRTTWYEKKIPYELKKKHQYEPLSVYAVEISVEAYFGPKEAQKLYDFTNGKLLYGIVTSADLSNVPDFLLFSREGNYRVHLKKVVLHDALDVPLELSATVLNEVKSFQKLLFSSDEELIRLRHSILQDADDNRLFIAPIHMLEGKARLDLDVINNLKSKQDIKYDQEVSEAKTTFNSDTYNDALVIPWYTPQHNERQRYCVLEFQTERNPLSPFDDIKKHKNFIEYYKNKGITIKQRDQPLLRGKPMGKQLNFLAAKYEKWKMSKEEKRDSDYTSSMVTLIPELQRIHPLPASLYVQSKFLPSCLHRINRLLLAHEIQLSVSSFASSPCIGNEIERHENALQQLNAQMKSTAESLLSCGDLAMQVNFNSITAASGDVKVPKMDAFTVRKTRFWVEIEYIHPKLIKMEDIVRPSSPDSDDSDDEIFGEDMEVPKNKIELIPFDEAPLENFDDILEPKTPLLESIMEAMTLANGRDFKSLEKLEMIGDSVLKLVVTLHIFFNFPQFTEGQLTSLRSQLVSNRHLYFAGEKKNLGEYLAGSLFEPETSWLPPGQEVPNKLMEIAVRNKVNYSVYLPLNAEDTTDFSSMSESATEEIVRTRIEEQAAMIQGKGPPHTSYTHSRLGDKSVADCVEALIGCYYLSGGFKGALNFMEWVGVVGLTNDKPPCKMAYRLIKDYPSVNMEYPNYPQNIISCSDIAELEKIIQYKFKNQWYLVEAFTHPTYMKNYKTKAYQRLEFLGDAILDFLVTNHIYKNQQNKDPGRLTDLRSSLVNNVTFGSLSVRYGLHKLLLSFSDSLDKAVEKFVNYQKRNGHTVSDPLQYLNDTDCQMAEDIDVPKVLGDIFESLAGAVFLDSNRSLDTVWRVFYRLMKNEIDSFSESIPLHPIRFLHEEFPKGIKFETIDSEHQNKFLVKLTVVRTGKFHGCGETKKSAKLAAAKYAVKMIKKKRNKLSNLPTQQ